MNTTSTPQTNATSLADKKNNEDDFEAAELIANDGSFNSSQQTI